jgi:3-oxoacyl-[acyl-carrier-protein] synthase II
MMDRIRLHDYELAVTGIGPICSIGIGRDDFAASMVERLSAVGPSERLGDTGVYTDVAECWDFAVEDYLSSKKTYLDRCSELVLAACALALEDARLAGTQIEPPRIGLALGSAFGCLDSMTNHTARVQTKGLRFGSPMIFTHTMVNSPTALAAIEYDVQGPLGTFAAGSISAACALEFAARRLRDGDVDFMLVGGCDALSTALLRGLPGPEQIGADFVPGEGAAVLVLERGETAMNRGAAIHAYVGPMSLAVASDASPDAALQKVAHRANLTPFPDVFCSPGTYGHTFGACMALDLCAAIEQLRSQPGSDWLAIVGYSAPASRIGPSAAVLVRSGT